MTPNPQPNPVVITQPFGNSAVALPRGSQVGLPRLELGSNPVNPSHHVVRGFAATFYAIVGWVMVIATFPMWAFPAIVGFFVSRRVRAYIRGSSVQITPDQLPEAYEVAENCAKRLGLKEVPEIYVADAGVANALAVKLAKKHIVILTDESMWGSYSSPNPRALAWIIGHELGHIALGHTGILRNIMGNMVRPLGRFHEMSADNVALALVGDKDAAVQALAMLSVGPQLTKHLNVAALARQAQEVAKWKLAKKAEKNLSHPLLMRRIHNMLTSTRVA